MSTITFHGSSANGRPAGPPRTGVMSSRDPVTLNRAARTLIQSGHWSRMIANDDRVKVMLSLKARLPFAVGHVHSDGLLALAKGPPPPGRCYWDNALMIRDLGIPELPRDQANFALLGPPCASCQHRWAVAEVADRERALQAAGIRRPTRQPAPTGTLWPTNRKTPVPSYYVPGRRR